jgi:hypothetical protein
MKAEPIVAQLQQDIDDVSIFFYHSCVNICWNWSKAYDLQLLM